MRYQIHETAIVDNGALIGPNTKIWHWSHVSGGAKIGSDVSIGQNVFIGNKVTIGNSCKIQNNVSIFDAVTLEEYVFCGPSVVFTNVYNPRAMIERKNEYKSILVKKGATLGANCTVVCGVVIGHFAFVAAGSVITKSVKPYALMAGNPAVQKGWMSEYGLRIPLPLEGKGDYFCDKEKKLYRLNDKELEKI